jgi:ABC-type transport system involved in cytochrome c biogenesis permease subunit
MKTILAPFASLKVTIVLLLLGMITVLAGTTAQREMGVQDVQREIFHNWGLARIQFHYFQPAPVPPTGKVVSVDVSGNTITIAGVSRIHVRKKSVDAEMPGASSANTTYKLAANTRISLNGAHTLAEIKTQLDAEAKRQTEEDQRQRKLTGAESPTPIKPTIATYLALTPDKTVTAIKEPDRYMDGFIYMPGGFMLMAAILVNLLAAHTVRFKLRAKRIGILIIHSGLILLIVGEILTSVLAVETQMRLDAPRKEFDTRSASQEIHSATNYAEDIRTTELAIVDHSPANHDDVSVIPESRLAAAAGGAAIHDGQLPFDVKVVKWYPNSTPGGPMVPGAEALADAGPAKNIAVVNRAKRSGAGKEASEIDMPAAFIALSKNGKPLGTYVVALWLGRLDGLGLPNVAPQPVQVDGKTYTIDLRFPRYYKPYTVTLKEFEHDVIPGTDMARDFASTIHLVAPEKHVDREVRIWMNHPLRYAGDTFYQQSFSPDDTTSTLQVVHNPAFWGPYVACAWGGAGLVIHFGITLFGFLRRRLAPKQGTVGALAAKSSRAAPVIVGRQQSRAPKEADRYTLLPEQGWKVIGIPLAVVALALIFVISRLFAPSSGTSYDLNSFGKIPIFIDGRVQPLDSAARNFLAVVNSGKSEFVDEKEQKHQAIEWLLDVMTRSHHWADDKVIVIDYPELKTYLGLKETEKRFSWNDLKFDDPKEFRDFENQAQMARHVPDGELDDFQKAVLQLEKHIGIYWRLSQVDDILFKMDVQNDPAVVENASKKLFKRLAMDHPEWFENDVPKVTVETRPLLMALIRDLDRSNLTREERHFLDSERRLDILQSQGEEYSGLFLIPPSVKGDPDRLKQLRVTKRDIDRKIEQLTQILRDDPNDANANRQIQELQAKAIPVETELGPFIWQTMLSLIAREPAPPAPESATALLKIARDYADSRPADFNSDVAAYLARVASLPGTETESVGFEVFFNHFGPFVISGVFYVAIFVLAFLSWLVWTKPLARTAFGLMALALIVHTIGIISRIYISGRPPVTTLYSASVFIGWGVVLFSLVMEKIFKNGIGLVAGSVAGFLSLLVAGGFALGDSAKGEADTMKQLQAVLDTNFWLATHVVCVSLGYMATVLSGVLSMIYICRGIWDRSFNETLAKDNARMVYGISCFAVLFSFVGTILGGIWADQSWGRFWGWDPKENGAILVVLANAIILHARWSGIVRERGVAVLAVLANIVVGWSMVGTNLMGVGLHSYGFMSGAQLLLNIWYGLNLVLAFIGMTPSRYWALNRGAKASAAKV